MNDNIQKAIFLTILVTSLITNELFGGVNHSSQKNLLKQITRDTSDNNESPSRDIIVLTKICGTERMRGFLQDRLSKLHNAGTSALPALASLLNRDIWRSYGKIPYSDQVIDSVRNLATEDWYDIHQKNETQADRVKIAIMSIDPNSEVALAPNVGMKKILMLGKVARPKIYSLLMSDATYRPYPLNVRRISSLLKILDSKTFSPTRMEIGQILNHGGEYGQFAIMSYAAKHNRYTDSWLTVFSHWMKTKSSQKQYQLLTRLQPPLIESQKRAASNASISRILSIALQSASQSVARIKQGTADLFDSSILYEVSVLSYRYRDSEYIDKLVSLNDELKRVLKNADLQEVLDHVNRYQMLKSFVGATHRNIQKLRRFERKKG